MTERWVDANAIGLTLRRFFKDEKEELSKFGSTINQVFESFVLASLATRYEKNGWGLTVVNPESQALSSIKELRLKFSTRGRPSAYTYFRCERSGEVVEIRHQLRVATRFHEDGQRPPSNIVLDVAVIVPSDLSAYDTDQAVPNELLITFGEAKHMSAFAELIASFLGVVHEMQPERLTSRRTTPTHPSPFLFVSGYLMRTARGLVQTVKKRQYDLEFYTQDTPLSAALPVPTTAATRSTKAKTTVRRTKTVVVGNKDGPASSVGTTPG